jgi:hypothetical protein
VRGGQGGGDQVGGGASGQARARHDQQVRHGHFALEDKAQEIAGLMRDFLGRVLGP